MITLARRLALAAYRPQFLAILLILGAAACEPRIDTRGHVPDPEALEKLKSGLVTRTDVVDLLGSPSSVGKFDQEIWYYISTRTETLAFYPPEVLEHRVVAVAFDQSGVVDEVREYGMEDLQNIEPIGRETPTAGKELGFFEQIIGNFGRFAKGAGVKTE